MPRGFYVQCLAYNSTSVSTEDHPHKTHANTEPSSNSSSPLNQILVSITCSLLQERASHFHWPTILLLLAYAELYTSVGFYQMTFQSLQMQSTDLQSTGWFPGDLGVIVVLQLMLPMTFSLTAAHSFNCTHLSCSLLHILTLGSWTLVILSHLLHATCLTLNIQGSCGLAYSGKYPKQRWMG